MMHLFDVPNQTNELGTMRTANWIQEYLAILVWIQDGTTHPLRTEALWRANYKPMGFWDSEKEAVYIDVQWWPVVPREKEF